MTIYEVRQQMKRHNIKEIPLRVTFYARVSTDHKEQLNSLENQITYYQNLIKQNPAWTYIPGYIDEGLSGISTKKRKNFNRMIQDARNGYFDMIITKEISRFARNTVDSLTFTRELLSKGVGIFFENDGICTFDEDSELRLSLMSSIAQDEIRKLSSRVKFGHQQAIRSGVVLGNSRIFGYRKDKKRLVIDEKEAVMIRELFSLYATDQYSMKQIEDIFYYERGYRNHNGKKLAHNTMANIIANPKYKGYYVGNKVRIIDMFTKARDFLPETEWVMYKDVTGEIVPAIVSEELWERANEVLRRRSDDVKGRRGVCNHPNLLTGKMHCTHCGKPFYRRESKDQFGNINSKWVCKGRIVRHATSCPCVPLYESELKPLLYAAFTECRPDAEKMLREYEEAYKAIDPSQDVQRAIREQQDIIRFANDKKMKLLELVTTGSITGDNFKTLTDACDADIKKAEEIIGDLEDEAGGGSDFTHHLNELRKALRAAEEEATSSFITKTFVEKFIDRIDVTYIDDMHYLIEVRLFTSKTIEKTLLRLGRSRCRTGQMSKKMVEKYENEAQNQG